MRCSSTGRTCSYPVSVQSSPGIVPNPSPLPFQGPEVRSLQFFTERTVRQLTTFFPDELWSSLVPQLSHSESGIQHALLSLASYHESFLGIGRRARDEQQSDPHFALSHYNLAIKTLLSTGRGHSSSIYVNLISCLIFLCIEVRELSLQPIIDESLANRADCLVGDSWALQLSCKPG
jgi:Fungal specific transcription factor domain